MDSSADANKIDEELAGQLDINMLPLPKSLPARALDGHLLGTVTHQTVPVNLLMSGNHHETIGLHVLPSPHIPVATHGFTSITHILTGQQG